MLTLIMITFMVMFHLIEKWSTEFWKIFELSILNKLSNNYDIKINYYDYSVVPLILNSAWKRRRPVIGKI